MEIEFFFDVASPYTYLAATQVGRLERRSGVPVRWRPFLLGGVFKATGNVPPVALAPKGAWMLADLQRWADRYGVHFSFPSRFPIDSLLPMRALTALDPGARSTAALDLFRAYWADGRDPADPEALTEIVGETVLARAADPAVKAELRATTEEAVARGAFGAPVFFVGDEMFFGNDRLDFVERAARRFARPEAEDDPRDVVRRLDRAWMGGSFEELADLFAPGAVMALPGFERRVSGRDALVESYREFAARCVVRRFDVEPVEVSVEGETAVVVTRWAMEWDDRGTAHAERGHDLFVLSREGGRWRVAWRTLLPG